MLSRSVLTLFHILATLIRNNKRYLKYLCGTAVYDRAFEIYPDDPE